MFDRKNIATTGKAARRSADNTVAPSLKMPIAAAISRADNMNRPQVLVVEDEPITLDVVATCLEEEGFDVVPVNTSELAQTALASCGKFQALVADIFLGGGLNGWELARVARNWDPEIAVVYTTGHGELDWPIEGVAESVLISKPYSPAEVASTLALLLRRRA